jgi:DNA-binding IclR family transcriptional regulator
MKKKPETNDTSRYHVPNLERALRMLEHLADLPAGATLTDVSNALAFPKNSVFRILSTLHAHDYVMRDEHTQRFRLSGKLLGLAYRGAGVDEIVERAGDVLRALRDETGETAVIGRLIDHAGVVLAQMPSRKPVKVSIEPGTRFMLHTSAPGKAIIASSSESECEEIVNTIKFTHFTSRTIRGKTAFLKHLETVRARGYAVDWGEEVDGINCVGAPVFDHAGIPVAAVWVSGPDTRLDHERFAAFGKIVMSSARQISERLGYVG